MQYSTLIRKKDKGYQYIITYKMDNRWKTKSKQGFKKKQDAQTSMDKALLELKNQLRNHVDPSLDGITFKEFVTLYLKHLKLYRSANTIIAFETVLNHFSDLNNKELTKITKLDIQEKVDVFTKGGLNPNTVSNYIRKLNTVFKAAKDEYNLISAIPTENLKINKSKTEINKKALNKAELSNLLEDFRDSKYYLLILIASTCGLRLGEILGLTWDNVDFKSQTLTINKQWKQVSLNKYDFGTLKSKNSNRIVPIPQFTLEELKKAKTVVNIDNRIFNFKSTNSVSISLSRLFKNAGYDITVHELRHTYATRLISSGIDFKTAAKLLGHTVEQTMKTYSHVNDDMMARATSIIENIF